MNQHTTAIIDYDVGNLKNVATALSAIDVDTVITRDPKVIADCAAVVLPGVGAFADAMDNLGKFDLLAPLDRHVKAGKLLYGICLGMQLLFDESVEDGLTRGLGLIPGRVEALVPHEGFKVPHMGWNNLIINRDDPMTKGLTDRADYVYFVHSYYAVPADFNAHVLAYADYDVPVPGIVRKDNVIGTQFHPEKSAAVGQRILENLKEVANS